MLTLLRRFALLTTVTELKAIAASAIAGCNRPDIATGIAIIL